MSWMLDSNAISRYLNGKSPSLKKRLEAVEENQIVVCSIVKAELLYGALHSKDPAKALPKVQAFFARFVSFPFDDAAASVYGRIRAELATAGQVIGPNDTLIAAIAIANDVTLVTHNSDEFRRVRGLKLQDLEV
jgi:tRNA(fMet)-specific endonuclease VapC